MRISDWSSDVCSSDLHPRRGGLDTGLPALHRGADARLRPPWLGQVDPAGEAGGVHRPEERRGDDPRRADRKSVVEGKSVSVRVDHGGRRTIKKKIQRTRGGYMRVAKKTRRR